ncbi:MAG TPA: DoxX family protein [Verrucomicrobiae bacterium]|nr:DoxX family protein [Verrucomicrobiae bacterium]
MNSLGLFILRTVAAGFVLKYGFPKLRDVDGTFAKEFESLGFRPPEVFAKRAGAVETTSGVLMALGLLGPTGPMLLLADMIVAAAAVTARDKRFDLEQHENEMLYASIAVQLILSGPGSVSLDRVLGIKILDRPWVRCLSLGAAIGGAAFMFAGRTRPAAG